MVNNQNKTNAYTIKAIRKYYEEFSGQSENFLHNMDATGKALLNLDIFNEPLNMDIENDLAILQKLLKDDKAKREFKRCDELINNIANELKDEPKLMRELGQIKDKIKIDIDTISNGIMWYQQTMEMNPRYNNNVIVPNIPGVEKTFIVGNKTQGALTIQLYISLVYMRNTHVQEILRIGKKNRCKVIAIYHKLMNSDYFRKIRNSLAHGTFKINIAGIYFYDKDEKYKIVAVLEFLEKINIWMFAFYYMCLLRC